MKPKYRTLFFVLILLSFCFLCADVFGVFDVNLLRAYQQFLIADLHRQEGVFVEPVILLVVLL